MSKSFSIRRQLLKWLLVPMLVFILVDSTILHNIAIQFLRNAFDHALYDTAYDISQLISEREEDTAYLTLKPEERRMLLFDQIDEMYFSIINQAGQVIGGDADLHYVPPQPLQESGIYYFDSVINGKQVRVASIPATLNSPYGPLQTRIQVAETLNKREHLGNQILVGIIAPQLLLLVAAAVLMWLGIGRGVRPLWDLQAALMQRSPKDLRGVQLTNIPEEVRALVDSINQLMHQLQAVLESQNRFIADAAHQLRTPLAGIMAQTELAQHETNPETLQKSLQQIAFSAERLVHMVNQLLILARNQPEVMRGMEFHSINLKALARHVTSDMVAMALKGRIDLGFEAPDEDVVVEGDATSLEEMLYNLIDNAIRYTPPGGKVTVIVKPESTQTVLSVEDNGSGIPQQEQGKVFERFHRVTGTLQHGSGLGLAIVEEIATAHNAGIQLESAEGAGTLIKISFPKHQHLRC